MKPKGDRSPARFYGGIDPSASAARPTGCAAIDENGRLAAMGRCRTDAEILAFFEPFPLAAVAIDAPKGLPRGMGLCCLEHPATCPCEPEPSRMCEREMRKRGFPLFPVSKTTFPAAKAWIRRGLMLYILFHNLGVPAFEVYPSAVKKILLPNFNPKGPKSSRANRAALLGAMRTLLPGLPDGGPPSDHELDAALAALTVYRYRERGSGGLAGVPSEGRILLPLADSG